MISIAMHDVHDVWVSRTEARLTHASSESSLSCYEDVMLRVRSQEAHEARPLGSSRFAP
jgi:hypothetical protein